MKKINDGNTGKQAADIIYENDAQAVVKWLAEDYPAGFNVIHGGTIYHNAGDTLAADIPGVSDKWTPALGVDELQNKKTPITSAAVMALDIAARPYVEYFNYEEVKSVEYLALSVIKDMQISAPETLRLTLTKQGGNITAFMLSNGVDLFINMLPSLMSSDEGILKYAHSQNYKDSIVYVEATLDVNGAPDFIYGYDSEININLGFKNTYEVAPAPEVAPAKAILSICNTNKYRESLLLNQTLYYKFYISEPTILGSVVVDVVDAPTTAPSWIECGIFPPDNGLGTAARVTSSDQIQLFKTGKLRLPLEHKLLQPGEYAIAFKTNADVLDVVSNVNSYRSYEGAGVMPNVAPNLKYPFTDKYGKFPAFALCEFSKALNAHFPADWHLDYKPEDIFLGTEDLNPNLLFYWHSEGLEGAKTIRLAQSEDGGTTKTFLHTNNLPENFEAINGSVMNAVSIFKDGKRVVYVNFKLAKIFKFEISGGVATWTDITPPTKSETITALPVASYAPLVVFKNYLYWGEYQDPDRPRIHKMNVDNNTWYLSQEKPRSGPNGARHVHFLYKSPINPNILWAVWGDASNGGGQGLSRLEKVSGNTDPDNWVQWSTGVHNADKTTLPYPTGIVEIFNLGIVGAGDQPPTHLILASNEGAAGTNLFYPLNFKDESAPNTETLHWLAVDDERTIYYMTVESAPYMGLYASPYPYVEKFKISKYWQKALAGVAQYSNGFISMGQFRFKKIKFRNVAENNNISKVPYIQNATPEDITDKFNALLNNLQKSNLLQTYNEQGSDKNQSNWYEGNQFENFN